MESEKTSSPIERMSRDFLCRTDAGEDSGAIFLQLILNMENGDTCLELSEEEVAAARENPLISAAPDESGLFILDGSLLFTRRNWKYERRVSSLLLGMSEKISDAVTIPDDPVFNTLHPCQKQAVRMMCENRFSILTGGPGTGKTYTIARAVKLALQEKSLRIGLAAPTGKAAARVNETMEAEIERLQLSGVEKAVTIQSLLESDYTGVRFKHNADNPLALDWVIVDEASMVDLPLMAKLLDALPPGCRLTLVGDAHQLASVDSGRAFGDLCHCTKFPKCELTDSTRFPAGGSIDRLARAVNAGNAQEALKQLAEPSELLHFSELRKSDFAERIISGFADFAKKNDPGEALKLVNSCRILCAMRRGPCGVGKINEYVMRHLKKEFGKYPLPVMITRNDFELGVSNGDVGVVMPDQDQLLWLPAGEGIRSLPLALFPERETAFASTIHKSQGSEYDHLMIVLPADDVLEKYPLGALLLTRELLYTAITRTKTDICLYSGKEAVRRCCECEIRRKTGLRFFL